MGGWALVLVAAGITAVVLAWWRYRLDQAVEEYGPNPPLETWTEPDRFFAVAGRGGEWVPVVRVSSSYNPHAHYLLSWLPRTQELVANRTGDGPHPASMMYTGPG